MPLTFYCGQFGHCHPCKTHQFHSRWGRFWRPQCIGFFYVERDAAERKCGTQDGERRPASEQCGTHCHEGRERTAQQTSEVQGAPSQIRTHAGQGHQPGHGDFKDVILIDKGSDEGLRLNMPVVNASGIIGIIDAVYPHMSKVLLITSSRSSLGGLNLRGDSRPPGL